MTSPRLAEILGGLEPSGMRLELAPFRALVSALGSPERGFPSILVAGTNGKGSTAALLESIARAADLSTGLYTSPHLEQPAERVRIDGVALADEELVALLERVLAAAGKDRPTYFEALTAAAFLAFAERRVDLAVLEVGLGGRLDATNVTDPLLSVVTAIGLDHTEVLGGTLAAIAGEKAGVFRRGRPAVVAAQPEEARLALEDAARGTGARFVAVDRAARILHAASDGLRGQSARVATARGEYALTTSLLGDHQLENLRTAVVAAEELAANGFSGIRRAAIETGVANARWPGRLEPVELPPPAPLVLLDAAHNPDGCRALARFLEALDRRYDLLFGALADKDTARMLPLLATSARRIVLTRPESPRALAPARLAEALPPERACATIDDPRAALDAALAGTRGPGDLVVVAGSIFLVGAIRRELRARFGVPPAVAAGPGFPGAP